MNVGPPISISGARLTDQVRSIQFSTFANLHVSDTTDRYLARQGIKSYTYERVLEIRKSYAVRWLKA